MSLIMVGETLIRQLHLKIIATLALLMLTSCASQYIVNTVKDIPLSQLDVAVSLFPIISSPNDADFDDLDIHVAFFISKNNPMDTPIFFSGDQTMICNGLKLTRSTPDQVVEGENPAFTGKLSPEKTGKSLSCIFTSSGVQIPITYKYPGSVNILTPHDGATVKRSKDFPIVYQPIIAANSTVFVMANIIDLDDNHIPFYAGGGSRVRSTLQPQTGTCHIDLSHANTGNSAVFLLSEVTTQEPASQFHSLAITYIDNSDFYASNAAIHIRVT